MSDINRRFKNYRISLNKTQLDISNESGISLKTIKNFENGKDIKVGTLEKLLNAIGYNGSLDNLIIDVNDRPIYKFETKIRKRARKVKTKSNFVWEEDR